MMGCDFFIEGRQSDPVLREKCFSFLEAYYNKLPQGISQWVSLSYEKLNSAAIVKVADQKRTCPITAFSDPMYAGTPVEREASSSPAVGELWGNPLHGPGQALWSESRFQGMMVEDLPIIFDLAAGGVLCQSLREGVMDDREPGLRTGPCLPMRADEMNNDFRLPDSDPLWLVSKNERRPCKKIKLLPGCRTRFSTGYPFHFTAMAAVKARFIPNLQVKDDYHDAKYFDKLMKAWKYLQMFERAAESDLPDLALEAGFETGKYYHWSSDFQTAIRERNQDRLLKISERDEPKRNKY